MKNKKQVIKGASLLVIGILLFVLIIYSETKREANLDSDSILGYANHNLYKSVDQNELLSILNDKTGVILISNKKTDINNVTKILYSLSLEYNEEVYHYDITDDEVILELVDNKVKVKRDSSKFYKKLLDKLGSFTEVYALENSEGELVNSGYRKIYTPFVAFVNKGKIVYSYYLSSSDDSIEELKTVYLKGFEMLSNNLISLKIN